MKKAIFPRWTLLILLGISTFLYLAGCDGGGGGGSGSSVTGDTTDVAGVWYGTLTDQFNNTEDLLGVMTFPHLSCHG